MWRPKAPASPPDGPTLRPIRNTSNPPRRPPKLRCGNFVSSRSISRGKVWSAWIARKVYEGGNRLGGGGLGGPVGWSGKARPVWGLKGKQHSWRRYSWGSAAECSEVLPSPPRMVAADSSHQPLLARHCSSVPAEAVMARSWALRKTRDIYVVNKPRKCMAIDDQSLT